MTQPATVLVMTNDDSEAVVTAIADAGFEVLSTATGAAATEQLRDTAVDCLVGVEIGSDGADTDSTTVIRSIREVDADVPVVVYGNERLELAVDGLVAAGVVDFVRQTQDPGHERLVGRVRNAVARRQAVQRAERQARFNEVIREVNQAIVRADTREAIEESVCEKLAASDQYVFAWIANVDEELSLRAMGVEGAAIEGRGAVAIDRGTAFTEPVEVAAARREVAIEREVGDRGGVWEAALDHSFSAVAAVPFVYDNRLYGVLVLYTDRVDAFDPEERHVLAELGETIAYAINAVAIRQRMVRRDRELRRQNERLENFASVVSHDLRNPLTVARGRLALLSETDDFDTVRANVSDIEAALDRMETIISDVLELARQGSTVEETAPVDLHTIASRAWATVDTGDVDLTVDGEATVRADADRLARLLENLFRNAMEHADPTVVRIEPIETDGSSGFAVEDDGPGIPEERRDDVMEMGHTDVEGGTGFGLAIVGEIAGAHGWDVVVTAAETGGARFEFCGVETPDS